MAADDELGAGINRAFIGNRTGTSTLGPEVPTTSIEWGRELNGITRPQIVVDPAKCTPALADVHPWAHSLIVFRNEERVWEGPIRQRRDTAKGLIITASDVLGWTERRAVAVGRNVAGGLVRAQMLWAIQQAFAADDPNVLAYVQQMGTPTELADLVVTAGEKYQWDVLSDMGGSGGRFTALGRSILLWDEATNLGRLRDLSPENHLLEDVDLYEDGDSLATRVVSRNDNGLVRSATPPTGAGAVDPFYGLVETIVASSATTAAGVTRTAQATANKAYPTPLTIDVPSTAALRCDAPFPIRDLVPGMLVPVQTTTATARQVSATFVLTAVKVTQQAGRDEVVTITLAPPSEAVA